jgi:hypothetical protein
MRIKMVMSLIFLMLLVGSISSCAKVNMYVLDQKELIKVKAGDNVTVKYDGWVLSQRAVDRVMNTKITYINQQ